MKTDFFSDIKRDLKKEFIETDLVVTGGGLAGVCCAITAAREGIKVVLINDRPVLGGNTSSEIRVWAKGATSNMGNNNRWSREGAVIDEILVENLFRNKEGNPIFFDNVLLDKVMAEKNISLFLNTIVFDIEKKSDKSIAKVFAFNPQNQTNYIFSSKFFADCSGDGIISYLAGASYNIGAEDSNEYNEYFAPNKEEYGELLGHSMFFYMKKHPKPVKYVAPSFALKNVEEKISRLMKPDYFTFEQTGCWYWWLEYGGRLDTIHDTEQIKYELWKVIYGVWDYIKNSGKYPDAANFTLEWVGVIPGKRESRRFNGYYKLSQSDIVSQKNHYDNISYGGWALDLHPADGVYSSLNACNQWHSKGVYPIPYRVYISRDIDNLFFGGRIISTTHVAHASSRVMVTCAHGGQAIGMAAALCVKNELLPEDYIHENKIVELQKKLIEIGHYIPQTNLQLEDNKINISKLKVSSELELSNLTFGGSYYRLIYPIAMLLPLSDYMPKVQLTAKSKEQTSLEVQIRKSIKPFNFTPEITLKSETYALEPGDNTIVIDFSDMEITAGYYFLCFMGNELVELQESQELITGVMPVYNHQNIPVSNYGCQSPPNDIGVDAFEFWSPKRFPKAKNLALSFDPAITSFQADNIKNSLFRPLMGVNAWVSDLKDELPTLTINWDITQKINSIKIFFDTDYDNALENIQYEHPNSTIPYCVKEYHIENDRGEIIYETNSNYQTLNNIVFESSIDTSALKFKFKHPNEHTPASVFGVIID